MGNILRWRRWSPYAVGAGIGILSWVTFALMGKALGTSTTMVNTAGMLESAVAPEHVQSTSYFMKYFEKGPPIDWQFALVVMLIVGALIARLLTGEKRTEHVPSLWQARFGPSRVKRYAGAFIGGAILLFGARLAGGCTSGHGISGSLQLAVSSWIFFISMFGAGVGAAMLIYRPRREAANV